MIAAPRAGAPGVGGRRGEGRCSLGSHQNKQLQYKHWARNRHCPTRVITYDRYERRPAHSGLLSTASKWRILCHTSHAQAEMPRTLSSHPTPHPRPPATAPTATPRGAPCARLTRSAWQTRPRHLHGRAPCHRPPSPAGGPGECRAAAHAGLGFAAADCAQERAARIQAVYCSATHRARSYSTMSAFA
jgi:hypothetical protein